MFKLQINKAYMLLFNTNSIHLIFQRNKNNEKIGKTLEDEVKTGISQ